MTKFNKIMVFLTTFNSINASDWSTKDDSCDEITDSTNKNVSIKFGNKLKNLQYTLTVNNTYNNSLNTNANFNTMKNFINSFKNNSNNDIFSIKNGNVYYNKELNKYKYVLNGINVSNRLWKLNLDCSRISANDVVMELTFDIPNNKKQIILNHIDCNNITELKILFNNKNNKLFKCYLFTITTNIGLNIISNVPMSYGEQNRPYFNYFDNIVKIKVDTGTNQFRYINESLLYFRIADFNEILLNTTRENIVKNMKEYSKKLSIFLSLSNKNNEDLEYNICGYIKQIDNQVFNFQKGKIDKAKLFTYFIAIHMAVSRDFARYL